jgi:hypothetical protein
MKTERFQTSAVMLFLALQSAHGLAQPEQPEQIAEQVQSQEQVQSREQERNQTMDGSPAQERAGNGGESAPEEADDRERLHERHSDGDGNGAINRTKGQGGKSPSEAGKAGPAGSKNKPQKGGR